MINPIMKSGSGKIYFRLDSVTKTIERYTDSSGTIALGELEAALYNRTDSSVIILIPHFPLLAEAMDTAGVWRPIQDFSWRYRFCATIVPDMEIHAGYKLKLGVRFIAGSFKTKLRIKAWLNPETIIVSDVVEVNLHPGMFNLNRNNFTGPYYDSEDRSMD